jgi:deoxyribose-phosphate aldolase
VDNKVFDHTILKPEATRAEVAQVCDEARAYDFASVCVNGCHTAYAAELLKGSDIKVCTVVGFPLGQMTTAMKCAEAEAAVGDGAAEIDMVINVGALKEGRDDFVREEIRSVKCVCGEVLLKVIIEACLLTDEEKRLACRLAMEAGADFVKTSTGFSSGGATITDVMLMREVVGDRLGVKASGGIRTRAEAEAMLAAGATRLGTSRTVEVVGSCQFSVISCQ